MKWKFLVRKLPTRPNSTLVWYSAKCTLKHKLEFDYEELIREQEVWCKILFTFTKVWLIYLQGQSGETCSNEFRFFYQDGDSLPTLKYILTHKIILSLTVNGYKRWKNSPEISGRVELPIIRHVNFLLDSPNSCWAQFIMASRMWSMHVRQILFITTYIYTIKH